MRKICERYVYQMTRKELLTLLGLTGMEFISCQPSSGDHVEILVQAAPPVKGLRWDV